MQGASESRNASFQDGDILTLWGVCRALKSAQVLELSGIGRKDVLEKVDVPVVLDLPGVGQNVQEHVLHGMTYGEPRRYPTL